MFPHGVMNLDNLVEMDTPYTIPYKNDIPLRFLGYCELLDQEPINLDNLMYQTQIFHHQQNLLKSSDVGVDDIRFQYCKDLKINPLFLHSAAMHVPLITHSEKNSPDIQLLKDNFYETIHYWVHAFFAKNWFMPYKYLNKQANSNSLKFGLYTRDVSGSRKYRIKLLEQLSKIHNKVYYNFQPLVMHDFIKINPSILQKWNIMINDVGSDASASIEWKDHNKFDIQIVPETLFHTPKTHLTEKVFKPIIMFQPFILVSGPYSLQYMKNYGFKTFDSVWDESYDNEPDSNIRFEKVMKLIKYISSLDDKSYQKMLSKLEPIIIHNRSHFYSQNFEDILINEMHINFSNALDAQAEKFNLMPGGTIFHYYNMLYQHQKTFNSGDKQRIIALMNYTKKNYTKLYTSIIKKYPYLLNI